jgi:hypothetical protein
MKKTMLPPSPRVIKENEMGACESYDNACKCGLPATHDGKHTCGFENHEWGAAAEEPREGGCTNCDGRKCMSCVMREMHDACRDDCPFCCPEAAIEDEKAHEEWLRGVRSEAMSQAVERIVAQLQELRSHYAQLIEPNKGRYREWVSGKRDMAIEAIDLIERGQADGRWGDES